MAQSVYIETSIPSAWASVRKDAGSAYRRNVTREWWETHRAHYTVFTSEFVFAELQQGRWPGKKEAVELMDPLARLKAGRQVQAVAARFVLEKLVPASVAGDAAHLAVACVRKMDYLLTWNIRHLANPNKVKHLQVITRRMGLSTPKLVTPENLWWEMEK